MEWGHLGTDKSQQRSLYKLPVIRTFHDQKILPCAQNVQNLVVFILQYIALQHSNQAQLWTKGLGI